MKKTAIVSCYFQHNYGSMLQAYATQMALDKLGYENETIDISGFNGEIKKAKLLYFAKASLTSDILLSKLGMAKNVLIKNFQKIGTQNCQKFAQKNFMHLAVNNSGSLPNTTRKQSWELNVKTTIQVYLLEVISYGFREILQQTITHSILCRNQ